LAFALRDYRSTSGPEIIQFQGVLPAIWERGMEKATDTSSTGWVKEQLAKLHEF